MENGERRAALNKARREAWEHALKAEAALDGVTRQAHGEMAKVWAAVGEVMKDGDPNHDGPGPEAVADADAIRAFLTGES
jgi:hypothetical protein